MVHLLENASPKFTEEQCIPPVPRESPQQRGFDPFMKGMSTSQPAPTVCPSQLGDARVEDNDHSKKVFPVKRTTMEIVSFVASPGFLVDQLLPLVRRETPRSDFVKVALGTTRIATKLHYGPPTRKCLPQVHREAMHSSGPPRESTTTWL